MSERTDPAASHPGVPSEESALRIVRGTPTHEELAVVAAVVAAASTAEGGGPPPAPRRGRWNDPDASHRRPWLPGPGAWRACVR